MRSRSRSTRGRRRSRPGSTVSTGPARGTPPSPPTPRGSTATRATFVALPDGTLLVEQGPDASLEALAAAVEQELKPPYRARAVRRGETLWAVQARRIEVLELADGPGGDTVEVTHTVDGTTLSIDDSRTFGSFPALEERGAREGAEYTVHADRLDGDLWEVRAAPL